MKFHLKSEVMSPLSNVNIVTLPGGFTLKYEINILHITFGIVSFLVNRETFMP